MKKSYKRNLRSQRGITLIALVITIIVLLILAAVSIATLTGENGILTQANKAKTETNNENIEEQVQLAFLGSYETDGKLDYSQLAKNLKKIEKMAGIPNTITEGSFPLTVTVEGEEIKIFDDGTIFNSGEWDKTATSSEYFEWDETGTVIEGYKENLAGNEKIRIPSKCIAIEANSIWWNNFLTRSIISGGVKKVELPETVEKIGSMAFCEFKDLEEVNIPNSVKTIGIHAFRYCNSLNCIMIPRNVEEIGGSAFSEWTSSQTINIQGYTTAPSGWDSTWNAQCSAKINWGQ